MTSPKSINPGDVMLVFHRLKGVWKNPTMPCAAKFWTCLRRLGSASRASPWP